MTTQVGTASETGESGDVAGEAAAAAALDKIDGDTVDFVLVFSAPDYDYEAVLSGVRSVTGDAALIGASTADEFTEDGVAEGSVTVAVVASDEMQFYTGLGRGLNEDIETAVAEAAAQLPDDVEGYPHRLGINLHDGLAGRGEEVTMLGYQYYPIPFTGGSAGDGLALSETAVFAGDEIANNGVALGLVVSEKPFSLAADHGHEPIGGPFEVTAGDGNVVAELDGESAFEVYADAVEDWAREHYGIDVHDLDEDGKRQLLTFFQFGIETDEGEYKVRWAGTTPDTSGPLHFATTVPEGTRLHVMHSPKQAQIDSARETARAAREGSEADGIAGALVFDCACRGAILEDNFDKAVFAMAEELDAPLAGFETYGEVCLRPGEMRGYHNTTSSVVLLPE